MKEIYRYMNIKINKKPYSLSRYYKAYKSLQLFS